MNKYSITWVLFFVFFSTLFIITLNNTIEINPITNSLQAKEYIFRTLPQGWAFFSKSPRDEEVIAYPIQGDKIIHNKSYKYSHYKNIFGLSRKLTKIQTEILITIDKIDKSLYFETTWNFSDFKYSENFNIDSIHQIKVIPPLINNALQGKFLIIKQKQVPWAWSNNSDNILMPAKAIILDFTEN